MGTRDQALFASISAVMDYLSWLGGQVDAEVADKISKYSGRRRLLKAALAWIEEYEQRLSKGMLEGTKHVSGLRDTKSVEIYGLKDTSSIHLRSPTFSFNLKGKDPKKVVEYLWDKHAVVASADSFYSRALRTYGAPLAIRASLAHYNTIQEIETFLSGLADAVRYFNAEAR
jgi:selenocysteine lyase/cysteine desulfurase